MSATGARVVFAGLLTIAAGAAFQIWGRAQPGTFPPLTGAKEWLNSPPLTPAGLRGKVVLVDFWTFTCINWMRTLPYLRSWAAKYKDKGLVVVGVHTPEFFIEKDIGEVRRSAKELGVDFPIATDNDYAIWRAFENQYWPALYVFDAEGHLRHRQFGEGGYEQTEQIIQQLLEKAGARDLDHGLATPEVRGLEEPADSLALASPETYVGHDRAERFVSPGGARRGERHPYAVPAKLALNQWALSGPWTVSGQAALSNDPNGRVAYRFHARDLNLVLAPATRGVPVRFRVLLDGQPPGPAHGIDVDGQGTGTITDPKLYQLIRQPAPVVDRRFEIEFLDPGAQVFSFTFG